jgi:hypothetical protein
MPTEKVPGDIPDEKTPGNTAGNMEESTAENTADNVKKIVDMFFGSEMCYEWKKHYHDDKDKHFTGKKQHRGELNNNGELCKEKFGAYYDKHYIIKEAQGIVNNLIKKEYEKKEQPVIYPYGTDKEFQKKRFSVDAIINIILLGSMAALLFFVVKIILSL